MKGDIRMTLETEKQIVPTVLKNILDLHEEGVAWRAMFQDTAFYSILHRTANVLNVAPLEIENIVSLTVACFDAEYSAQKVHTEFYVFTTPRGGAVVTADKTGMRALREVAHFDGSTFDIRGLVDEWQGAEGEKFERVWGEYIEFYFDETVEEFWDKIEEVL